ncbi:hypothetical protein O0R52_21040 [Bacillus halotolerans]|uniref:NERD domain-containing protein n=2 Tax=Bacillus subtilis group TaxID=653685 RepID=A0ABY7I0F8_9BACI|nr:hypothetical protein [Bacillus halotolerans]MDG0764250.1 hypothetical protein [Bacillus halotolerans]UUI84355.1 hypothetical protein NPA28_20610 [Bacillus halotolerans]WAT21397.1 hypothetical protein O0R52_21040 [Bacillus halotolerans]
MMIINKEKIKQFCKKFRQLKTEAEKLEYLKKKYIAEEFQFHRIFLHSGQIYNLSTKTIDELLIFIKYLKIEKKKIIEEDLDFLQYLLEKKNMYLDKIIAHIHNNPEGIYAEDLLNYLEYLNFIKEENGCSIDGKVYPKNILNSQYNHVLDSFSGIIEIIRNYHLPFKNSKRRKINDLCNEIYQLETRRNSLRSFINATMMELNKPRKINDYIHDGINFGTVYLALKNPPYWSELEIYRDLNFIHLVNDEIDFNVDLSLAKKAGCIRTSHDGEIMHIDYDKGHLWLIERDIYHAYKLISPIYGDRETVFYYKNKKYRIDDLLSIFSSIQKYILLNKDEWVNKFKLDQSSSLIGVYGKRELLRRLGLSNDKVELLELLSFDIDGENKHEILNYKPLIRRDNIYYILPTWINHISLERSIDKILSDKSIVQVCLLEQTDKGLLFEDTIESFFKSCNIEFFKTKRDEENGLPEIDGMFIIDDYLFIFEAKASIKPENIIEAYNHLNSILAKAKEQLDERMNILLNDKERTAILKNKIKLNISGLKIVPFILINHHFFNGYTGLLNETRNNYYPIIDFLNLKEIIINKKIACWEYNEEKGYYNRLEFPCTKGHELEHYLKNQIACLISCESPTFQILDDKVMFKIVKPLKIRN